MTKDGRGHISSLDKIPEDGYPDVLWALDELNKRSRTQADILFELNDRLAILGYGPISKSSFNRKSVQIWRARRVHEEGIAIAQAMASEIDVKSTDDLDIILRELAKAMILRAFIALSQDDPSALAAMQLSRAYKDIVAASAQSDETKQKQLDRLKKTVDDTAQAVGKAKGLTPEAIQKIRADILGVPLAA